MADAPTTEHDPQTQHPEYRGADASRESRPGDPMEAQPRPAEGAHWDEPVRQQGFEDREHRAGLRRPTPVFGTAQPLRGVSGAMRRAAYRIPEHRGRHWFMLMAADRVDLLESRLGPTLARPARSAGLHGVGDTIERNPLAVVAGALAGGVLLRKLMD